MQESRGKVILDDVGMETVLQVDDAIWFDLPDLSRRHDVVRHGILPATTMGKHG